MRQSFLLAALFIFFCFKIGYNQPNRLDSSFGDYGIVKTSLGKPYSYYFGYSGFKVLSAPDGAIFNAVEVNNQTFIIKRHPDGSVDSSYGNKGYSELSVIQGHDAVMQPDGKIIVAGSVSGDYYSNFAIVRYNSDGSLDHSFNGTGNKIADFGYNYSFAASVALQDDGQIVVAGYANGNFAVVRLNVDGTLDFSFSNDGKQMTDFGFQINIATSVDIQKDGKIVVVGYAWNGSNYDFALARYNADGSLDNTFSADGKKTTSLGGNDYAYSSAILKNGKILVAGFVGHNNKNLLALTRYNTNGSLDSTFDVDGKKTLDYDLNYSTNPSIAIQGNAKIVMAYYVYNGSNYDFAVSRFNTNGSLDNTFSGDGKQTTDIQGGNDYARALAIQKDGKILVTGGADSTGTTQAFALCRYNTNGTADDTFNKDGKLHGKLALRYTVFKSTVIQEDGKLVAAGYTWNGNNFDFALARYNKNGNPDTGFAASGSLTTSFGKGDDIANAVAIQADGKIVVAGSASNGKYNNFAIARYNVNGEPDNTFSSDGKEIIFFGSSDNYANAMVIQKDGKIMAAGLASNKSAFIRLTPDGDLDHSFGNQGKQTIDYGEYNIANSIELQSNGKIVVASDVGDGYGLSRLNTDGSLDKSFAASGKVKGDYGFIENYRNSLVIQADGKIVVAGNIAEEESNAGFALARYGTNGKRDSSFGTNGTVVPDFYFSFANSVTVQSDGKILIGGSYNDHSAITRLTAYGAFDSSFGSNGKQIVEISGEEDHINNIAVVNDKLYAVGSAESPGYVGTVLEFRLDKNNTPPTVKLTAPTNNATYLAPAAHIKLSAAASDADGTISKVEFYNGTKLLHTETVAPYGFMWRNVLLGNYTITAKAYDNSGLVTTSAPVNIAVVPNKAPNVSIINPANHQTFGVPAYIHFEAAASDYDGKITRVEFYNGSTLVRTEYQAPYTYVWKDVPAGVYTITAVATDNWGAHTTSAPVTIKVKTENTIVSSRALISAKTDANRSVSLRLSPNPARNIVNVYTTGLQQDKPATISIISTSGNMLKKMQINISTKTTQLDVSSLASGVYTIKMISGDKVLYKQFVKL